MARQLATVPGESVDLRMLDDAGHQHQAGHQADDYGIPEGSGHGHQRLALGVARLRRRSNQRSGTHTGFIGEQTSGKAVAARHGHGASDKAAAHCPGRESRGADRCDRLSEHVTVDDQNDDAADHIEDRHERYQHLRYSGDRLDAADDHEADDHAQGDRHDPGRDPQVLLKVRSHRVGLNHTSDSETADGSERRENDAQPFHVQAAVQRVHCAADHRTVLTLHAVFHSNQRLRVFRSDTEHAGKPGPQDRSGSSKGDRRTDADDVAGTDR